MKPFAVPVVCVLVAVAPAAAADPKDEVLAALKALNDAFPTHNPDAIRRLMTADHLAVTPWGGVQDRDAQLKTLPELKLSAYEPGPQTVTVLGPDAVAVTYTLTMKGTFRGAAVPEKSYAAAVWVKDGGAWKEKHYQETPLK